MTTGMRMDALAAALADHKSRGITPKYIYTIPTVQNPTGSIMPESRRAEMLKLSQQYGVPIFEDDCYADLIWNGERPPAIYAMSQHGGVIHIGSFSKSIAPALRVGFIVAPWEMMSRMLALKTDAGSGALEQMVLAEYCAPHFSTHVPKLTRGLRAKLDTLMEALNEQFGTAAEFEDPKGGIFLWVKLPDNVDTLKLYQAALAAGVAINPGPEWSTDKAYSGSRLRLCFASPVARADPRGRRPCSPKFCRKEFGVGPARSGEARAELPGHVRRPIRRETPASAPSPQSCHYPLSRPGAHRAARHAASTRISRTRSRLLETRYSCGRPSHRTIGRPAIQPALRYRTGFRGCLAQSFSQHSAKASRPRSVLYEVCGAEHADFLDRRRDRCKRLRRRPAFSVAMTSGGVPAGATTPNQPTDLEFAQGPARPACGTSGRKTTRFAAETPSASTCRR